MDMKKLRTLLVLALIAGLSILILAGCGNTQETETPKADSTKEASAENVNTDQEGEMHKVQIDVKDYGSIVVELDSGQAPITVANFLELAKSGFYDGLTFHRIIDGFMIQGGDPEGTGMGGADKNIKGEFAANGVNNNISHVRGVISMARSGMPDSASSQFFIVHKDSTFLDGEYAAFGKVLEGMDVVDKLAKDTPVVDGNGTVAPGKKPIIEKVTVLD
jgi:peptidyl-prolyl cis-trans isomerase B (cyclophilin B)